MTPRLISLACLIVGLPTVACQDVRQTDVDSTAVLDSSSRIAVLPFETSGDSGGRFFGVGLATEVERSLVTEHNLTIVPLSPDADGSAIVQTNDSSLAVLGERLGASHVLTGSIRRRGPRTEIALRLVRTRDSLALWSGTYWRETSALQLLPADLTADVVDALRRAPRVRE